MVRVENMKGNTGKAVTNQFLIYTSEGVYFQSYNSIIAFKPFDGKIQLDANYWDYSKTSGRYRNNFLQETKAQTKRKIESGEYVLADLN